MNAEPKNPILIVDDNPDVRRLLLHAVKPEGYSVLQARTGTEALQILASTELSAVLLDLRMPDISGIEVCRRIRADVRTAALPVLMITGNEDLESRLAGFEAGVDDYIPKPFDMREIITRLRSRMELASLRSELARLQGVLATTRLVLHEFNNPIQILVGALDLLGDESAAAGEAMAMLRDATDRLRHLSTKVVTISEPAFQESPSGTMLDLEASR